MYRETCGTRDCPQSTQKRGHGFCPEHEVWEGFPQEVTSEVSTSGRAFPNHDAGADWIFSAVIKGPLRARVRIRFTSDSHLCELTLGDFAGTVTELVVSRMMAARPSSASGSPEMGILVCLFVSTGCLPSVVNKALTNPSSCSKNLCVMTFTFSKFMLADSFIHDLIKSLRGQDILRKSVPEMRCWPQVTCLRLFKRGGEAFPVFCLLGLQGGGGGQEGGFVPLVCVRVCGELSRVSCLIPGRQKRASWAGRSCTEAVFIRCPTICPVPGWNL